MVCNTPLGDLLIHDFPMVWKASYSLFTMDWKSNKQGNERYEGMFPIRAWSGVASRAGLKTQ